MRNRLGIEGNVTAPFAVFGDVRHELHIGVIANRDGGDRDAVARHLGDQRMEIRLVRQPVRQHNDMFDRRLLGGDAAMRFEHRFVKIGAAVGLQR